MYRYLLLALFVLPLSAHAGKFLHDTQQISLTLLTAIVIGFLTSIAVLLHARRIGGGALQRVYTFFGLGMILIVSGLFVMVLEHPALTVVAERLHDLLMVLGFGAMAYGARHMMTASGMK